MTRWLTAFLLTMWVSAPVHAQSRPRVQQSAPPATGNQRLKTTVEFELLAPQIGASLSGQRWGAALQKLDVAVRVRSARPGDEPGVSEKVRGTLRWVTVVGQIDARGRLIFPGRSFSESDLDALKEWIDELLLYGAQGAPEGRPLWGLTQEQFAAVYSSLSQAIAEDSDGQPLETALTRMNLPAEFPVRFHTSARRHLAAMQPVTPVRQRLGEMSNGTGLALLLADYGLGYRPLRTPEGGIELVIQPLEEISDPWPVGWELPEGTTRGQVAPELFRMVPVGFNDVPLEDVLLAISEATQVPVCIDHYATQQKGIDPAGHAVSYPQKKSAWMVVINRLAIGSRLKQELRIDELGRPFVYVYPFVPKPIPKFDE